MAEQIITLGIGGTLATLTPFITTGLEIGVVVAFVAPDNAAYLPFRDKRAVMAFEDNRVAMLFEDRRAVMEFRDKRGAIPYRDKRALNNGN